MVEATRVVLGDRLSDALMDWRPSLVQMCLILAGVGAVSRRAF